MEVDKTYQIYSEVKKQLFEERFRIAKEYLSKEYDGISIVIYKFDLQPLTVVKFLTLRF